MDNFVKIIKSFAAAVNKIVLAYGSETLSELYLLDLSDGLAPPRELYT